MVNLFRPIVVKGIGFSTLVEYYFARVFDTAITKKIMESGNVIDIQLLDHLIIVPEGNYNSMADEGII